MAGGSTLVWLKCLLCPRRIGPYQDQVMAGGRHYHLKCWEERHDENVPVIQPESAAESVQETARLFHSGGAWHEGRR